MTCVASVRERAGSWRVEWRRGGRAGSRESCTFPTREQADGAARLAEARGHNITSAEVYAAVLGLDLDGSDQAPPTVAEFAGQWVADRRAIGAVQPDTLADQNRILIRHILPYMGDLPITAVSEETITGWLGWMRGRPSTRGGKLDADTVRRVHEVLRAMLRTAVPRWLAYNPAAEPGRRGHGLPKTTAHEPMFLTAAEVDRILACCDPLTADMAATAVRTGLRLGELLVLQVGDVQLDPPRRLIRVRRALKRDGAIGEPKTRRSRRDVSISADLAERLRPWVEGRRARDLLFPAPGGGMWHPSNLRQRHWLPALGRAQRCEEHPPLLPAKPVRGPRRQWRPDEVSTCDCPSRLHRVPRWHDLRHTHASLCAEAGWDMIRVSRRLGHESITTTINIYGHLWDVEPDDRLDAVEKLLMVADDETS